jgi:hypothetical protein
LKKIILLSALIILLPEKLLFAQEVYLKGGLGFYNIYEENILTGREREIKLNPTPTISAGLSWDIGSNFFLGGEIGLRMKSGRVEYIGLDTSTNSKASYGFIDFYDYNFDIKALLKYNAIKTSDIVVKPYVSSGLSVRFYDDFEPGPRNYSIVQIPPDGEMPPEIDAIINNSGLFIEGGIECSYNSLLISIQYLFEFFSEQIYNVGDIKTGLLQVNVGYRF